MHFKLLLAAGLFCVVSGLASSARADKEKSAIGSMNMSIATVTAPDSSVLFEPGFGFQLHMPYVEAGMQFEASEAEVVGGSRSAWNYVPIVGAHLEKNKDQELIAQGYAQLRLPLQIRSGAQQSAATGTALGAEVGGRVWACKAHTDYNESDFWRGFCFGASLSLRYQHHLSDFQMGSAVLPEGSGTFAMPFMMSIGFNPRSMQ